METLNGMNKDLKKLRIQDSDFASRRQGYCLSVTFVSARQLRQIIDATADLANVVEFSFSRTGMTVQAMDSASVCLLQLDLYSDDVSVFSSYSYTSTSITKTIGVDMPSMQRVLRCGSPEDNVLFMYDEASDTKVHIVMRSPDSPMAKTTEVDLKLVNTNGGGLEIVESANTVRVVIPSASLSHVVKNLSTLAGEVILRVSETGQLVFQCQGDGSKATIALTPTRMGPHGLRQDVNSSSSNNNNNSNDGGSGNLCSQGTTAIMLSLRHFMTIIKATPLSEEVTIELTEGMPMCVVFRFQPANVSRLRYYLGPILMDDEDPEESDEDM